MESKNLNISTDFFKTRYVVFIVPTELRSRIKAGEHQKHPDLMIQSHFTGLPQLCQRLGADFREAKSKI